MQAEAHADLESSPYAPPAPVSLSRASITVSLYGLGHLAVDATCAAVIYGSLRSGGISAQDTWTLLLLYNLLAFGTQAFLGAITDLLQTPRLCAIVGCLLTASAVPAARFSPLLAVCVAGIGNSLFHVGGGAICLTLAPGRAGPAGLFVAPGAIGLALGMFTATTNPATSWPWAGLLLLLGVAMSLSHPPCGRPRTPSPRLETVRLTPVLLLCFAIAVRAVCGSTITAAWRGSAAMPLLLAIGAALGKGFGGLIADRFGWLRVTILAVLASIPLVSAGTNAAWLALSGMLLLQATTGVTLAALSRLFPDRPSFSFGLASLAVLIGSIPSYGPWQPAFGTPVRTALLLLASAVALLVALQAVTRPARHR